MAAVVHPNPTPFMRTSTPLQSVTCNGGRNNRGIHEIIHTTNADYSDKTMEAYGLRYDYGECQHNHNLPVGGAVVSFLCRFSQINGSRQHWKWTPFLYSLFSSE